MIWLFAIVYIVLLVLVAHFSFQSGKYTAEIKHSTAMIRHHDRMLAIMEDGRIPTFTEFSISLDILRYEETGNSAYIDRQTS